MGRAALAAIALATALALGACGGGEDTAGGARGLNWYVFNEPSGAYQQAVDRCNEDAGGRYRVTIVPLPTDATQQRELLVRRLAAEDGDIDIIGMDVIWTAEFAEAGWIREWRGRPREEVTRGTIEALRRTGEYQDRLWAAPFTTNTQLLWYRRDLVPRPPRTWDEMLRASEELARRGEPSTIQVQGAQYEGYTVWFNTLVASAGGQIVTEEGEPTDTLGRAGPRAARIMQAVGSSEAAASPSINTDREDPNRLAFQEGGSAFMVNYPFVYPSAREEAPEVFRDLGVAPYPAVEEGRPARVTLGGINLGVSSHSQNPDLAFEAATCIRRSENQLTAATLGGLFPTLEELYEAREIREAYPFADILRESLENGVPRPVTPAYADVSLAVQRALHAAEDIEPEASIDTLREYLEAAGRGGIF